MISVIYFCIWLRQKQSIFLFWFAAVLIWQTIPSILNDLFYEFDDAISFDLVEKIQVQFFEFLGLILWCIPFLFLPKINAYKARSYKSKRVFFFIVKLYFFLGLIILIRNLIGIDIELPLSFLYLQLSIKIVPIFCVYTIFSSDKWISRLFSLLVLLVALIGGGSHGPIFFVGIYAIYLSYSRGMYKKYTLSFVMLGVVFLSLFGDLMHEVRALDVGKVKKLTFGDKLVLISGLSSEIKGYNVSSNFESNPDILQDAIWRFGENRRVSSGYIRWVNRYGYVGFAPIKNSLMSIIPRQLWSDKPEPGSYNGNVYGKGMHVIHKMTYGNEKNMSGFYTGLHEYWQLGLFGILFLSVLAGLLQYVVLVGLSRFGEAGILVIIAVYSIWWQMPKLWFSEVILHSFTIYLPLVILFILSKFYFEIVKLVYRRVE